VRDGNVATRIAIAFQAAEEFLELLRRHVGMLVSAIDPERAQPVAVQHRRAGMPDRVAHDARAFHAASTFSRRSSSSKAGSGRPRIVKWSPSIFSKRWIPVRSN